MRKNTLESFISNYHLIAYDLKQGSGRSRYVCAVSPDNRNLIVLSIRPTVGLKFLENQWWAGEGWGVAQFQGLRYNHKEKLAEGVS